MIVRELLDACNEKYDIEINDVYYRADAEDRYSMCLDFGDMTVKEWKVIPQNMCYYSLLKIKI